MTLPLSGPISFSNIQSEFGGTNPISFSEYYRGGAFVAPSAATSIPTSGNISLSNFRGATAVSYQITTTSGASTNENTIYSFTVSTTGLSTGTNVYWLLSGLQGVDYTANIANYGSLKTVANTTLGGLQNANTKVDGYSYGSIVNNLYLRQLGRYPESVGVVETLVTQLVNGNITVEALESNIANSPEATAIPAAPNGVTQTFANGNAIISGYVVNDFRYEGTEVANLVIFSNAVNGTEVARYQFSVVDTSNGILDIFGVPGEITEGTNTNISLYTIGSQFVNSNVQVRLTPPIDGSLAANIGSDITINGGTQVNVFVATGNATITTFILAANSNSLVGGTTENFLVRAYTEGNTLIASTGNVKIVSGTTTTTTTTTEAPATTTSTTTSTSTTTTTTAAGTANLSALSGGTSGMYSTISQNRATNIYLYFEANGSVYSRDATGTDVVTGNWFTPITGGIGSSYWIRWTPTVNSNVGAGNYYDPGSGGWQSLSSQKSFGVATGANDLIRNISVSYLIEIASDSGGSTIVTSATHSLEADVSSGM